MANAQVQTLQYAQNKFGIDSLVLGGHRYRVKNKRNNRVYWRCTIPACPSTVNTHEGHLVKIGPPHNHQANQSKIEVIKIMQTMKQRAKNEVTPIQAIYEEELVKLRTPEWNDDTKQIVEQLPTYYSCKTSLYHQRALDRPVLPKTTIDIDLQDEWCLTTTRQQFLLPSDNIYPPMLIFSTTNNLTHLAAANTIFCDGTFYSCPTLFHQLYTVHAMIDGSMFPLVFVSPRNDLIEIILRQLSEYENVSIIVTTSQSLSNDFDKFVIGLQGMTETEAVRFLNADDSSMEKAKELARRLSYLPDGLVFARTYLHTTKISINTYIERLENITSTDSASKKACEMIICEAEDSMSANEKKVLHLMPYLNTDNIPIFVLKSLLPNTLSRKEKAILIDHFLRTLDKYSLISHITGLDEHRVVAAHRFTLMIVKASSTAIEREKIIYRNF
ncbi:unnamed protein product [Mytilus edulis]|uniref:FLYWCH-type domain-containing protein n=1 Tax=Mytilus edulis TaxID=6550 RepID=A0A8S3PN98_MYTED|nr:unnamed protein product [Mytilus edulis]